MYFGAKQIHTPRPECGQPFVPTSSASRIDLIVIPSFVSIVGLPAMQATNGPPLLHRHPVRVVQPFSVDEPTRRRSAGWWALLDGIDQDLAAEVHAIDMSV